MPSELPASNTAGITGLPPPPQATDFLDSLTVVPVEGLYAIAAALLSITLAALFRMFQACSYRCGIRSAIKDEFKLMLSYVDEVLITYEEFLTLSLQNKASASSPAFLETIVFDAHYPIVAMGYSIEERMLHDYIRKFRDEVNEGIRKVRTIADQNHELSALSRTGALPGERLRLWFATIKLEYGTVAALKWHLEQELSKKGHRILNTAASKAAYTKYMLGVQKKLDSIV